MTFQRNNIILGFDTSCYTTSIAAISLDKKVILNEKRILEVKKDCKGLRQSEAVFQHVNNLGEMSKAIKHKLENYNIVGVCASSKPRPIDDSYMPVFTVGLNFGKLISSINNCPFFETSHQENHIEASLLNNQLKNENEFLTVHMSGGTTEILLVNKKTDGYNIYIVGGSLDVSFGQLIDRLGVKIGCSFPCGKYIDEKALNCNKEIRQGLKTSVKNGYMNLSGIENQINKLLDGYEKDYICKLLLDTLTRCMYKSLLYICKEYKINEILFAGGVSASKYISGNLSDKLEKEKMNCYFTENQYATDNGLGCAIIGLNQINNYVECLYET
ncbi:MAG: O-sialoglycoprotein endopeptidase [Terrisporobacter sp.]